MQTDKLISALAQDAKPVDRLWHPSARAMVWMLGSGAYVALLVWLIGLRADLADKLADPRFLLETGAALMTSMMAAGAALCAGCPGRPTWERFAPFPFLAIWLATLGEGCWRQWVESGGAGLMLGIDLVCFQNILIVSSLPAVMIFLMIRRGAPLAPMSTTALATLAATALGATALRFFHAQDVSPMLLVWQFGSVIALAGFGFLAGRHLLTWSLPQISDSEGRSAS